jgi:uncharacterized membrane protein
MNFLNTEEYHENDSNNNNTYNHNGNSNSNSNSNNIYDSTINQNFAHNNNNNDNQWWRVVVTGCIVSLLCFITFDFCYYYFYGAKLWEPQLNKSSNQSLVGSQTNHFQSIATVSPALQSSLKTNQESFKSYLQYRYMPFTYFFMVLLLLIFVVLPDASCFEFTFSCIWKTFLKSSILGLCVYGIFQFKNASMIYDNNQSLKLILIELLWGSILFGITGIITCAVTKTFDITKFSKRSF